MVDCSALRISVQRKAFRCGFNINKQLKDDSIDLLLVVWYN